MTELQELKSRLKRGQVYRRSELAQWSKSIDRDLDELLKDGTLQKMSQGIYYFPKETAFGKSPPEEKELVRSFLKDERFLLISPNVYNCLGVGTTQLYNTRTVYNHKRHGEFKLGNRIFNFQLKHHFPPTATPEFLLVDLVNNLEKLAEDQEQILKNVLSKAVSMNGGKLKQAIALYGKAKTRRILEAAFNKTESL
jgi:hypothetical protein